MEKNPMEFDSPLWLVPGKTSCSLFVVTIFMPTNLIT
jgi:hypothetical protein